MNDYEFEYLVSHCKWADGFTTTKTTKATKILGNGYEWGFLWMLTGGFCSIFLVALISFLLGWSENIFGLSFAITLFAPVFPLQIMAEIARNKLYYNREIEKRQQMNLFRDFNVEMK